MISRCEKIRAPLAANRAAGFTLIEMIVVLTIIALLAAFLVPQGDPVSPATRARATAEALAGALRSARTEALASNRSVSFTLDLGRHSYHWGKNPPQSLPDGLGIVMLTSRDETAGAIGVLRFDPDGGSSGGRIALSGGDRSWWVGVDWLSGRVSIVEKPRQH